MSSGLRHFFQNFNQFIPETSNRPVSKWLVSISVFFVISAVYIKLWTPISLNRWPEALYTLTFFYGLFKERRLLSKHPMVIGLFVTFIATPLLFYINYLQNPVRAEEYAHFEKLMRVYLFVPIGYWLSFNIRYVYLFVFFAFAGMITACLQSQGLGLAQTFHAIAAGYRVDFGLQNAQHLANWSGLFLIACLSAIPLVRRKPLITKVLLALAILTSVFGIYAAQTRAIFIGLVACFMLFSVLWFKRHFTSLSNQYKALSITLILIAVISVPAYFFLTDNPFKQRFAKEQPIIVSILHGDLSDVPNSSIGIRIHSWATAVEWIKQKPIVGWGGDVREHVIDDVEVFSDKMKGQYGHMHNVYLEFMLGYGLIGTLIALWPLFWVFRAATDDPNHPISNFAFYMNIQFLLISCFESYLFFWSGVFTVGLYIAPLLALNIRNRVTEHSQIHSA